MEQGDAIGVEAWSWDFPALRFGPDELDNLASFSLKAALFDGTVDSRSCDSQFFGRLCDGVIARST